MKKKNWISKEEEQQIISTYELYKGEIVPYGNPDENMYEITTVRKSGNIALITISAEFSPDNDYPRILVKHSDANGKRTFTDVWDRNWSGQLYWRFRNPADVPISDRDFIESLESKTSIAEGKVNLLQKKYQNLIDTTTTKPSGRPPHPEKLDEQAARIKELLDQGLSEKEITEMLGIGRATFYRMKKRIH